MFLLQLNAWAQIKGIWLTHARNVPSHLTVQWETTVPASSAVFFGPTEALGQSLQRDEKTLLHRLEIPFPSNTPSLFYAVQSECHRSRVHRVKTYSGSVFRAAVVADWQSKPALPGLLNDDVHLLLTAGDNISDLHSQCTAGVKECWKPYSKLVSAYPDLFSTVPVMPALGNHDREIRSRGRQPPPEPVYDIEAAAFRTFFSLPDEGWKWHFDVPEFGVRFVALDLNHTSDHGTTWQTCHLFAQGSVQFDWYRKLMARRDSRFVITLQNEQNSRMRRAEKGEWGRMFQQGSAVITGFGYFAERAEVDGFPYFNTALGVGDRYPDPNFRFFASTASYVLLEFERGQKEAIISIKNLEGKVLDRRPIRSR